ncbi:hypothetical protein HOK51_01595 [Candidatus Woesearchaeota archaeon]|jgi:hypothetical protein|nr:hypothetical protein [Candidatus Woesearchaeota archaeon]MBT6518508.1 hypothetical protein [Candidatus Woesearchaeota archaeon]MBT7368661.1 hypothetical protein [Candidatus Woesearchaeota archaeon]
MKQKWTPQRIIVLVVAVLFVGYKLMNESSDFLPIAIGALILGGVGTLIYFYVAKKGIFAK